MKHLTKNGCRLTPSGFAPRPVTWAGHDGSPIEIARVAIDDAPAGYGFMCPREALQDYARRVVEVAYEGLQFETRMDRVILAHFNGR